MCKLKPNGRLGEPQQLAALNSKREKKRKLGQLWLRWLSAHSVMWRFILCIHRRLCLQPQMRRGWSKSTTSSSSCLLHITGQVWSSVVHPGGLRWNCLVSGMGRAIAVTAVVESLLLWENVLPKTFLLYVHFWHMKLKTSGISAKNGTMNTMLGDPECPFS